MSRKDSLNTASDFWSSLSITGFFKSFITCGCDDRGSKIEKSEKSENAAALKRFTQDATTQDADTNDQNDLDRSWMTEEYIEYHPEEKLYEVSKPLIIRSKERLLLGGRNSLRTRTGKGNTYKSESDDDNELNNTRITRKKIKKQKEEISASKSTTRVRNLWQPEEDDILKKLIKQHGKKWSVISKLMGGTRTGKQIRDRYLSKLDPTISERQWTMEEDQLLVYYWRQFGNKWAEIAKHMEGRTESMVKNRYYSFISKRLGPDGELNYEGTDLQSYQSGATGGEPITQTVSVQRSASTMTEENSQPAVDYVPNRNTMAAGYGKGVQNDDIFLMNRSSINSKRSNSGMFGRIPLLPHSNSFEQMNNDGYYNFQRTDSFLSLDKQKSNTSELRMEIQRSLGNSYDSRHCFDILGLRSNYAPGLVIEEDEDAKSDRLPSSDPYGYPEQYGMRGGQHLQAWKDQMPPNSQQIGEPYSEDIMRRFGSQKFEDDMGPFMMTNDMEIEGQLDKFALILDSRTASMRSKHSDFNGGEENGQVVPDRMSMLQKRQQAIQLLLAKTSNEMEGF